MYKSFMTLSTSLVMLFSCLLTLESVSAGVSTPYNTITTTAETRDADPGESKLIPGWRSNSANRRDVETLIVDRDSDIPSYTKCETKGDSPSAGDCHKALLTIDKDSCVEGYPFGSGCRNLVTHGSCTLAICAKDTSGAIPRTTGAKVRDAGMTLLKKCAKNKNGKKRVLGYNHNPHGQSSGGKCFTSPDIDNHYINTEFF